MANNRTERHVLRLPPVARPGADGPHAPLRLSSRTSEAVHKTPHAAPMTSMRSDGERSRLSVHALAQVSGVMLFPKLIGKVAAMLLIPMIFFHPLLPLYAEEFATSSPEVIAPAEDHTGTAEGTADAAASELTAETNEETTPADVTQEGVQFEAENGDAEEVLPDGNSANEAPVNPSHDNPPANEETSGTTETPAENDTDTPATETNTESRSAQGEAIGETATSSAATTTPALGSDTTETATSSAATTTPALGSDTTETATSSDTTATSTGSSASSDANIPEAITATENSANPEAAPAESGPSFEERLSAALEARSAMLREEIRRQVEREWTSGCVALEGTGYYCLKYESRVSAGETSTHTPVTAVSVRPGSGGDNEIFITKGMADIQLTENDTDDAFPAKDAAGESIVWQSQENGRWQIYVADMTKTPPEVVQLTSGTESNFNPKVDGATIVWQAWIDNNWEIVMADRRKSPLAAEEMTPLHAALGVSHMWNVAQLTHDPAHDMFPSIAGGLVTWQKNTNGTWGVWTASIATGASVRLSSATTKSENPRFAMVWEERTEDGGVRLVGYDVAKGEKVDLTDAARNIPDRSPDRPETPVASSDPAALPPPSLSATGSIAKPDGDDGDDGVGSNAADDILTL